MKAVPFKQWLYECAQHEQVSIWTIFKWKQRGLIRGLKFNRRNKRVIFVSGESKITRPKKVRFVTLYPWQNVDWSKPNFVIARDLGCNPSTVVAARKRCQ